MQVTTDMRTGEDKVRLTRTEHDVLVKAQRLCAALARYEDTDDGDAANARTFLESLCKIHQPPAPKKRQEAAT